MFIVLRFDWRVTVISVACSLYCSLNSESTIQWLHSCSDLICLCLLLSVLLCCESTRSFYCVPSCSTGRCTYDTVSTMQSRLRLVCMEGLLHACYNMDQWWASSNHLSTLCGWLVYHIIGRFHLLTYYRCTDKLLLIGLDDRKCNEDWMFDP